MYQDTFSHDNSRPCSSTDGETVIPTLVFGHKIKKTKEIHRLMAVPLPVEK